jgi:hypothetical protein
VRFQIEQRFEAPLDEVLDALSDPDYLHTMGELPDMGAPEVRRQDRSADGRSVAQELVFQFQGRLPGAVTRVIDPKKLSWVEHADIDLTNARARFRMVPVHYPRFFTCAGTWSLQSGSAAATTRRIEGDLKVNSPVPFVGGQVEKAIVSGLRDRLAHEPAVFARWRAAR